MPQKSNIKINFFLNIKKNEVLKNNYLLENEEKYKSIKENYSKYKVFTNSLIKTTKKNNNNSKYITQGCCQINNTNLLTYYDGGNVFKHIWHKNNNLGKSILEVTDEYGRSKTIFFDHCGHVGGINYSKEYNKIYVTRHRATKHKQATITCYDIKVIASAEDNTILTNDKYKLIELPECLNVSYLTVDENKLYIGDFHNNKLYEYKLLDNGLSIKYEKTYKLNFKRVQGMCSFTYKNNKYYAFSCSYGRAKDSILRITKLINDNFILLYSYKLPCMSEQISVDNDGNLMIVFESDSIKYSKGLDNIIRKKSNNIIDSVCHIDIKKLFQNDD